METVIETLTKETLERRIGELALLEHNWTELGETPWNEDNFKIEIPGKWELSTFASLGGEVIGYAIASLGDNAAKLNKILVARDFRGNGVATSLWESLLARCRDTGVDVLEFKVLKDNEPAIEFYRKKKCIFTGESLGKDKRLRHDVKYVFATERISHSLPSIGKEEADAVYQCIISRNISRGNRVRAFESLFSGFIGRKFGVATNSGASALYLALRAFDIKQGDEVIIPSYVCNSVLNALRYTGATPVLGDIDDFSYNLSLEDTRRKITPRTKAIILPHMFGKASDDLEDFIGLGIPVIEDCALSVGGEHNGRKLGSFGKISVFSFYATKVMTTGTGGMILSDDDEIIKRLNDLLEYDNRSELGESYNYAMNDMQAAIGFVQLKKLPGFIEKRKKIADIFRSLLEKSEDVRLPDYNENIFFRYVLRTANADRFIMDLRSRGVDAAKPVFIPLHRYFGFSDDDFPNTSKAYEEAVSIPIYPDLTDRQVSDIAGITMNSKIEGSSDEK